MKKEKTTALRVGLNDAEKTRRYLINEDLVREDLIIEKDEKYIYFPLKDKHGGLNSKNITSFEFRKKNKKISSYKDLLDIEPVLKEKLPTSITATTYLSLFIFSTKLSRASLYCSTYCLVSSCCFVIL